MQQLQKGDTERHSRTRLPARHSIVEGPVRIASDMPPSRILTIALPALALVAWGCRGDEGTDTAPQPGTGEALVTEEIAPPPDHLVDPTTDLREKRRAQRVAGVLPGGFPDDLPLPDGGSLTDFSDEGEPPWVELTVPRRLAEVRGGHQAKLAAAGWRAGPGDGEYGKAGRAVRVEYSAAGPSTQVRIHYP
jgi:hypothetical protein